MNSDDRVHKLRMRVIHELENARTPGALGLMHLHSVSILCTLLAKRRGLGSEICASAGLLHDVWLYMHFPLSVEDHRNHGTNGAILAREILEEIDEFVTSEIDTICSMIERHDDKSTIDGAYEELLKDADVLDHRLRDIAADRGYRAEGRDTSVLEELGVTL